MKIKSLDDLRRERVRLKIEISETEQKIKDDFEWINEELKPIKKISKGISNLFNAKENSLVGDTVGAGLGLLVNKLLLKRSSWIMKLIIPIILRNVSSNLFSDSKTDMMSFFKNIISSLKKDRYRGNGIYDKSTAHYNL
jgi:hypothetical protein